MSKTYVLDTNVLLNDPNSLYSFAKGDVVVIPHAVVEELEKHKHSSHGDLGTKARQCSRSILKIFADCEQDDATNGVEIDNGSTVKMIAPPANYIKTLKSQHDMSYETGDDKILATALYVMTFVAGPGETVLVTEDVLLKIRAITHGMAVKSFSGDDMSSEDDAPKTFDQFYPGYRRIKVSGELMGDYWTCVHGAPMSFGDDTVVLPKKKQLTAAEKRNRYEGLNYDPDFKPFEPQFQTNFMVDGELIAHDDNDEEEIIVDVEGEDDDAPVVDKPKVVTKQDFLESEELLELTEEGDPILPNEFVILEHGTSNHKQRPWALLKKNPDDGKFSFLKDKPLEKLKPLNIEQHMAINLLLDPKVQLVTLMGAAGTGKTLLALEAGLNQVLSKKKYSSVIILRPVHSVGKDIGYLPGTFEEKMEPWIAPIKDNLRVLLSVDGKRSKQTDKTLEMLFEKGTIEIEAITFIRGRSIDDAFIIIDEGQNLNRHELKTILTRAGKGTKIVITGDIEQTDRTDVNAFNNGLSIAVEKFKKFGIVGHVTLKDGVRSELSELAAKIL